MAYNKLQTADTRQQEKAANDWKSADLTEKLKYFSNLFQCWQHHSIVLHFLHKLSNPRRFLWISILHIIYIVQYHASALSKKKTKNFPTFSLPLDICKCHSITSFHLKMFFFSTISSARLTPAPQTQQETHRHYCVLYKFIYSLTY